MSRLSGLFRIMTSAQTLWHGMVAIAGWACMFVDTFWIATSPGTTENEAVAGRKGLTLERRMFSLGETAVNSWWSTIHWKNSSWWMKQHTFGRTLEIMRQSAWCTFSVTVFVHWIVFGLFLELRGQNRQNKYGCLSDIICCWDYTVHRSLYRADVWWCATCGIAILGSRYDMCIAGPSIAIHRCIVTTLVSSLLGVSRLGLSAGFCWSSLRVLFRSMLDDPPSEEEKEESKPRPDCRFLVGVQPSQ